MRLQAVRLTAASSVARASMRVEGFRTWAGLVGDPHPDGDNVAHVFKCNPR